MDFNLKQWKDQQQESEEEQPSAKIPRQLLLESPHQLHHQQEAAALPLFVSADPQPNKINSHMSAYPDHSSSPSAFPTSTSRFPRVGGGCCFSISQWQELELQALIFRHMVAGAAVPPELLQLVKKSLLASSSFPYHLHHYPPHFQSAALLQAGYWGKGAMDPEPGRCRRTDGKKWRCSREVVVGHKYCERHMHRGRNRSRKPVEFPPTSAGGGADSVNKSSASFVAGFIGGDGGGATHFTITGAGSSSLDAFQLNQRSEKKALFESQHESHSGDAKSNSSKVLMHFFDDWPRSLQEPPPNDNPETNGHSPSGMCLTMSTNGNPTSDFLRLSTGNVDELGRRNEERERAESGWANRWGSNPVGSMGGPLAEALRSSTNLSPTSVLHQLPRCSTSDTSYVSA